jgi:prephenate dehydratase
MKIAYQGVPGAFSEDAVHTAFPDADALAHQTIREVFDAVDSGEAQFGVVPLENSQAGSINETYELLLDDDRLSLVGEVVVPVNHALLARRGTKLEEVRWVFSHPQALAQCDEFLRGLKVERVPVFDTAGAARRIAEEGEGDDAAIASTRAAELFGLEVLAEKIQTFKENHTKFAVIGNGDPGLGVADKTSLVFAVKDRPGSLYACLMPYAEQGVNLTKLESRPRVGAPFEYVFYMDVEISEGDGLDAVLDGMRDHTSMLKVLGSYPRWKGEP